MVKKIHALLQKIDYFRMNPEQLKICPIQGDVHGRSFVYALMEGQLKSHRTLLLLSHFDVVGVEEYGTFKEYAFNPIAYTRFLKDNPQIQLSDEARIDLESDDYLFGRGTMDMKFGIAADLEMLRIVEKNLENFPGNILFLSVPDEEANSVGMLAAIDILTALKQEKSLEYICCLVSEPHFPKYPGDMTKYIYTGTVGKLLPAFYCVGKETHVGEPFSGLNPNLLTAKIIEHVEQNPKLSDYVNDTYVPAPVCLKQSDTKTSYSVQTPTAAYTYFNYMTLSKTPQEVMLEMQAIAEDAFSEVLAGIKNKAAMLFKLTGNHPSLPNIEPKVVTFQALYAWCQEAHGAAFESHIKEFIDNYAGIYQCPLDLRELSIDVVKEVHQFCPYRNPMIVLFYAPPFYPHSDIQQEDNTITQVCRYIIDLAKHAYDEHLQIEPFFPGLSDMSYLGLSDRVDITELIKNFPVWGKGYQVPLASIAQLNIPFINIGPLGKDAHKYTERLCLSYSFEKAVPLLWATIQKLFGSV
ncbi:MAG: M20/M25/M40 family metallo-hydrolase, partial [Rhizobium sp.]|nr:M20/M25/M40 family metallo-hydrolase [Rhizobium sp.]